MNFEELKKKIDEYKAQGLEDEDILNIFFEAFTSGEMPVEDLEKCAGALGYEFSDEFKAKLSEEAGAEEANPDELTEDAVEDMKEIDEDESTDEFKDKIEQINAGQEVDDEDEDEDFEDDEDDEDEDEDDEKEQAMKLFGLR